MVKTPLSQKLMLWRYVFLILFSKTSLKIFWINCGPVLFVLYFMYIYCGIQQRNYDLERSLSSHKRNNEQLGNHVNEQVGSLHMFLTFPLKYIMVIVEVIATVKMLGTTLPVTALFIGEEMT